MSLLLSSPTRPLRRWAYTAGTTIGAVALLAGCASSDGGEGGDGAGTARTEGAGTSDVRDASADGADKEETAGPRPRLVATYDGGLLTLDAGTLEVVADTPLEGFLRVNPAGDGRTVMVTTRGGFRAFDAGTWSVPHGDHTHSYTAAPRLTERLYAGNEPGHVVFHEGRTTMFSDGDGRIQVVDTAALRYGEQPEPTVLEAEAPHHGVAVALPGGAMLETVGTAEVRSGARVVDAAGDEIAATDDCPGVHGEAAARDGRLALGCESGAAVWDGSRFTAIDAPDGYGRVSTLSGSEASPVVLGDYKTDENAEHERSTRVSLTDTATARMRIVDLGTSYSSRSLGRGPAGEALVLGTDGRLHVLDPATGEETRAVDVVAPWTEPERWQDARPTLLVLGGTAFVTDPAEKTLHAVDLHSGEVRSSAALPHELNEIAGADAEVDEA